MADYNGVNYAKTLDSSGENVLAPGLWGGRIRVQSDTIESATAHQNKTIQFGKLPKGAVFIGIVVSCESAWGGSVTGTFKLGSTTISAALDLNTGFGGTFIPGVIGNEVNTAATEALDLTMTVSNNAVTAGKTIQVQMLYSTD